jgi:hypothetical protein
MTKHVSLFVLLGLLGGAEASPQGDKNFAENKDGQIVIEAEHFHAKADKDPHKWVVVKEPAGFSGDGAVEAKPNDDVNNNEDFVSLSPRMDYKVKFAKAGKYRVWIRGWGKSENDNSCHVGLDGKAVDSADRIGELPAEEWAWLNDTHDGEPAEIDIKDAGVHTLNVWMREDGVVIDKILLTQDKNYSPKDKGPAESRE